MLGLEKNTSCLSQSHRWAKRKHDLLFQKIVLPRLYLNSIPWYMVDALVRVQNKSTKMRVQSGGNHRNPPEANSYQQEQLPPTGLGKQGKEHRWGLVAKAALGRGMPCIHSTEECCLEEPGVWLSLMPLKHYYAGSQKRQGSPLMWPLLAKLRTRGREGCKWMKGPMKDTLHTFFPLWSFVVSAAVHWVLVMGIH